MCTVKNATQVVVCDVSRDAVKRAVGHTFNKEVTVEAVPGEGTLFTCLDPSRTTEFQQTVSKALRWTEERWTSA
jgi:hypothetical protein